MGDPEAILAHVQEIRRDFEKVRQLVLDKDIRMEALEEENRFLRLERVMANAERDTYRRMLLNGSDIRVQEY